MTDWRTWHDAYDDPGSALTRRLRLVQAHVETWLDATAPRPVQVLSLCSGEGRDLLEVLARRDDAARVRATLVERDPVLAGRARSAAAAQPGVEVFCGDAGDPRTYVWRPPADLVLLCGVLGNISDDDVRHTVDVLPALCAPGARVVWTRSRREPDLTPRLREWFSDSGFREVAFTPVPGSSGSVGVADLVEPRDVDLGRGRLFTFAAG